MSTIGPIIARRRYSREKLNRFGGAAIATICAFAISTYLGDRIAIAFQSLFIWICFCDIDELARRKS